MNDIVPELEKVGKASHGVTSGIWAARKAIALTLREMHRFETEPDAPPHWRPYVRQCMERMEKVRAGLEELSAEAHAVDSEFWQRGLKDFKP